MPVIPAKKGDWSDLFFRVFMLWLDPSSPKINKKFVDQLSGHFIYAANQKFPEHVKIGPKELKLIHSAPPRGVELTANFDLAIRHGSIAGMILYSTLRLAHRESVLGSVENGIRLTEYHLQKLGMKGKRATIMKAWGTYKSVSPWWAASIARSDIFKTLNKAVPLRISRKTISEATDVLPIEASVIATMFADLGKLRRGMEATNAPIAELAATAERLRELAEGHYAPGQKVRGKPLLAKDEAWRAPKDFELPPVKLTFKRLSPSELKAFPGLRESRKPRN